MSDCRHAHPPQWHDVLYTHPVTGETYTDQASDGGRTAFRTISLGRSQCSLCGQILYTSERWRDYYEHGVPCFGSDGVDRALPKEAGGGKG